MKRDDSGDLKKQKKLYDIECDYSDSVPVSIYSLAKELSEDYIGDGFSQEDCEKKLKSICSNIKKYWHIDLKAIVGENKLEKFKTLQMLKVIFRIEKVEKVKRNKKDEKFSIIKMIGDPHRENVWTYYSNNKRHEAICVKLKKEIWELCWKYNTNWGGSIYEDVPNDYSKWYSMLNIFSYAIIASKISPRNQAVSTTKYNEIYLKLQSLANEIENKQHSPIIAKSNKPEMQVGVLDECFYKIYMGCIAFDNDDIQMHTDLKKIEKQHPIEIDISENYLMRYKKSSEVILTEDYIADIVNHIEGKTNERGNEIWNLITYDNYDAANIKSYRFAVKYFLQINKISHERFIDSTDSDGDLNYFEQKLFFQFKTDDSIKMSEAISIIQALIYIDKNEINLDTSYYKHERSGRKLTASIRNKQANSTASEFFMIGKIISVFQMINIGAYEIYRICRDIEKEIFRIRQLVFGESFSFYLLNEKSAYISLKRAIGLDLLYFCCEKDIITYSDVLYF